VEKVRPKRHTMNPMIMIMMMKFQNQQLILLKIPQANLLIILYLTVNPKRIIRIPRIPVQTLIAIIL
jgi:hypothetical protein